MHKAKNIAIKIGLLILFIILFLFLFENKGIPCVFYKITGFYCPGCGITRCIYSLLCLNFYQAFRYNMLGFCLIIFAFIYLIYVIFCKLKGISHIKEIPNIILYFLLITTILFAILRNIPFFSYLAPTII